MKKLLFVITLFAMCNIVFSQCPTITCPTSCSINCSAPISLTATSNYSANISSTWFGPGGAPLVSSGTATSVVSINLAGTYTVQFKDNSSGCTSSVSVLAVNQSSNPTFNVSSTIPSFSMACTSGSMVINIVNASTTPPGGAVSYSFCPLTATPPVLPGGTLTPISSYPINSCGNYVVFTRDNVSSCVSSMSISVACSTVSAISPTVSGTQSICTGGSATLNASGATSYTWMPGNIIGSIAVFSPTVNTCYTVVGSYTNGCSGSALGCVIVAPNPTLLAIASSTISCPGNTLTLMAAGANSYTWQPGNATGTSVVVSPTTSTNYSVTGVNASGCASGTNIVVLLSPAVNLSISPSQSICPGSAVTLSCSGATSYTWNTGAPFASIIVSPTGSSCYTVVGSNASGCTGSVSTCLTVYSSPTVAMASSGNSLVCAGSSRTLTASGAGVVAYNWSTGASTSSIVVSPSSNICYSVTGVNANGCTNSVSNCFSVVALPTLALAAGNTTVCQGSSTSLTVSGASSYTWSTNPAINNSTANVMPAASTTYTVTGANSNGCTGTLLVAVNVNTTCSMVWPGDANSDGVVDNTDVFELGLAASATGPARSPASIAYTSQFANNWSGTVSTGKNKCHADCDGNGTVNNNDTSAISANYMLTHAFRSSSSSGTDIRVFAMSNMVYSGMWNKVDIELGDPANQLNQLYGVAFDLNYDKTMIQPDSVKIIYNTSFINTTNQNINFGKAAFNNGKMYCATVRTNGQNVNGDGKIAEFWFKVKNGLPENSTISISASNAKDISSAGVTSTLGAAPAINVVVTNNVLAVNKITDLQQFVRFFPNPANEQLTLQSDLKGNLLFSISDISGRTILNGEFNGSKTLSVSALDKGTYFIKVSNGEAGTTSKLLVGN